MKKRLLSIVLMLALVVSAFAGGSQDEAMAGKIQLKLGIWPEESQLAEVESMTALKAQFEAEYPNIEVIPAHYKYAADTFMPLAAAGELPTIYETWFTEPQKIIENGFAADITDIAANYNIEDDMNPSIYNLLSSDNRLYGIPRDGYALGLYINMNLFREAGLIDANGLPLYPKTFDELINVCGVIREKTGKAGMYIATKDNVGGWHFSNLAWNFGASFSKEVNGEILANIDSPEVIEAFEFIQDLKWEHNALLDNSLLGWSEWIQNFGTDQVAMVLAANDVVQLPVNDYGMNKDSIAMAPIPAGPRGDQYSLMGGTPYMFAADATDEEIDAAIKWLEFTGRLANVNEETIASRRVDLEYKVEAGHPVGPQALQIWMNQESNQLIDDLYSELQNVDMNLFNPYYDLAQFNLKSEESYYAQDLYALLDGILQEIMIDSNADIEALCAQANRVYQENFLDLIN